MALGPLIVPPIIAILLYLTVSYGCLPLFRERQRYAQYMPISLPSGAAEDARDRILNLILPRVPERVADVLAATLGASAGSGGWRARRYSGLSDEELDPVDGLDELHEHEHVVPRGRVGVNRLGDQTRSMGGREDGEGELGTGRGESIGAGVGILASRSRQDDGPRLSRDLEAGFRDDSDEEEEDLRGMR